MLYENKDKIDFKTRNIMRQAGNFIMMEESVNQENITIINTYTPKMPSKYVKKKMDRTEGKKRSFNNCEKV